MHDKIRLDQFLVQQNLARNREEAQRLIRAGKVRIEETVYDKPGIKVSSDAPVRIIQKGSSYASRGGLKLEAALRRFGIDVTGLTAADLGASTGGFTDCLLRHGAAKVFAVDVGRGQLAYPLQTDPRVVVMDRTNCRYLDTPALDGPVDLVVVDLSFIGIQTVFPAIARILKPAGQAIVLIKPQFEIGKEKVGKKGIVKNPMDHLDVLLACRRFFIEAGWAVRSVMPSPIAGKSGNIEFLMWIQPGGAELSIPPERIQAVVDEAHPKEPDTP
ncbi:MAG: TlyA family RNA methyltransferase [Candidatus Omnitrophica bacterium]|nr:TlyA family RNA methyltransferase [Candidatus Omnitrophota bacterium]